MERLQIDRRGRWSTRPAGAEDTSRPLKELGLPLRDLVGVNVIKLRQFGQCLVALESGERHLRLESRCVVPADAPCHRLA